jgi:serine-type D-Ala-D-Ala carboxypeptidase (penicillin-binding protein 5/6)
MPFSVISSSVLCRAAIGAAFIAVLAAAFLMPPATAGAQEPAADPNTQSAPALAASATRILLMDEQTGTVLLSRNADEPFAPASFAKLMTAELVFHLVDTDQLSLRAMFKVSEDAWRRGGAPSGTPAMFAKLGSEVAVADLLRGLLIQGANDAALILAEGISGSEAAFTERLNERAAEIGLRSTVLANATGFDAPGAQTTLADLVKLGRHFRKEHLRFIGIFAEPYFEWNKIRQSNRNPLLDDGLGADGFLTAASGTAGLGLLATAEQNGRRIHLAMSGVPDAQTRAVEAKALLAWGFKGFKFSRLVDKHALVAELDVYGGTRSTLAVMAPERLDMLLPVDARGLEVTVSYDAPLVAPIETGDRVARLQVINGGETMYDGPLVAAADVEQASLIRRALAALFELAFGWMR